MSVEEDNELRDLVAQTLENNGVLGKIRAQLRASVFLALEEQSSKENKNPLQNKNLNEFITTNEGKTIVCLIREFLEYFNLEFTQSVYAPETGDTAQYVYEGRQNLTEELNIDSHTEVAGPLLLEVFRRSRLSYNFSSCTQISPSDVIVCEKRFSSFDNNNDGKIDRATACDLFMDVFPNFRRTLLERFVNDELQECGKKYNDEISFQEFTTLYQKFFNICQSVVMPDTPLFNSSSVLKSSSTYKKNDGNGDANNTFIVDSKTSSGDEKNDLRASISELQAAGIGFGIGGIPTSRSVGSSILAASANINGDSSEADDSFFDDPLPAKTMSTKSSSNPKLDRCSAGGGEGKSSSLANTLPALVTVRGSASAGQEATRDLLDLDREEPKWTPLAEFDKKLADLEFNNSHDDDYDDDDFQSSEHKSGAEPSISEEIEEDTSAFGDILGSTASGISLPPNDNMTTDKTVSQISGSGIDYIESIAHDSHSH